MLIAIVIGFLFWSPLEYFIHRFLGHEWTFRNKFRKEHQKHHFLKDYFASDLDKVLAALPFMAIIFSIGIIFVSWKISLMFSFGFLISYLFYEKVHKDLHIKEPKTKMGKALRKHHFHHHFENPKMNHGVTTRFWDRVFGTFEKPDVVHVPEKYKMVWLNEDSPDYTVI